MIIHGTSDNSRPIDGIEGYYASINEAIENIFVRTRQYAKRQKKWFNVNNYDISFDLHEISKNDIVDKLIQIN